MVKGAFGAGFAQGFGKQFTSDLADREERRDKYLDLMIGTGKKAAAKFKEDAATAAQKESLANALAEEFDFTDGEIVALVQNYDVETVYKELKAQKQLLAKAGLDPSLYDKNAALAMLDLPDQVELPQGMTRDDAFKRIWRGYTKNIVKNPDKKESSKNANFASAVSNFLALNPKASAEDMAKGIQIGGIDLNTLLDYSETGGTKGRASTELTLGGPFEVLEVDYSADQMRLTKDRFGKYLAQRFTGASDITSMLEDGLAAIKGDDNSKTKQLVVQGSSAFGTFETQLIGVGITQGMNSSAERFRVMNDVVEGITDEEALETFIESVRIGDTSVAQRAVEIYNVAKRNQRALSDEEVEYILTGQEPESGQEGGGQEGTVSVQPGVADDVIAAFTETPPPAAASGSADSDMELPNTPFGASTDVTETELEPAATETPLTETPATETPLTETPATEGSAPQRTTEPRMRPEGEGIGPEPTLSGLGDLMNYYAEQEGVDLNDMSDENRDARVGILYKAKREMMSRVTYDEWKEIRKQPAGQKRLQEMGLPTTLAEVGILKAENFKEGIADQEKTDLALQAEAKLQDVINESRGEGPATAASNNVLTELTDILNVAVEDLQDRGTRFSSVEKAKEFIRKWFRDNIPGEYISDPKYQDVVEKWMAETLYDTFPLEVSDDLGATDEELDTVEAILNNY